MTGIASASRQTDTETNCTRITGQFAAVTNAPRLRAARNGSPPSAPLTTGIVDAGPGGEDTDTAEYSAGLL
jgi:hypothetical protein